MAVHHAATIVPTKLELLQTWVPHQPWLGGTDASVLSVVGAFRFDDPDGEVGIETHLLGTADGRVLQVPLTYRGAPRPGADDSLITTMTHTTLGDRWIYDACHDPVYLGALVTAVLTGGREADLFAATDGGLVQQEVTTHVRGTGSASTRVPDLTAPVVSHREGTTTIHAGLAITLRRTPVAGTAERALTGSWPGQETPLLLATVDSLPTPGERIAR